MNGKIKTNKSA